MKTGSRARENGFSLLEVLIVIAVLGILAVGASGAYRNYARNTEFELVGERILSDLKHAQVRAMGGEDTRLWGVHFVNSAEDYYELFSTPTTYSDGSKTVTETVYLSGTVTFSTPAEATSTDILFSKISGTISSTSTVVITFEGNSTTVTVTAIGRIY